MRSSLRSRAPLAFGGTLLVASLAALASCGEGGEPPTVILGRDAGGPGQPKDGATVPSEAGPRAGTLRLVHAGGGLPTTVDFCTRTGPQDLYAGPVLGGGRARDAGPGMDASASDGAPEADADGATTEAGADAAVVGVTYLTASQYVSVPGSGTVELAVVPAGTGSCAQPLAVGVVTLEPGKLKTVVVFGGATAGPILDAGRDGTGPDADLDAGPGDGGRAAAGIAAFDDVPGVTANRATLRLIYAAAGGPTLSATLYATRTTTLGTLAPLSALRAEADAAAVDALGYALIDPGPPPTTLGLREQGSEQVALSAPKDLGLTGGSLHTGFVVRDATTSAGHVVLYCNDVSTEGPRTQCSVLSFP